MISTDMSTLLLFNNCVFFVFYLSRFLLRFPLTQSFGTILAIFDVPKDQNLFFESATLFCLFFSDDG